MNQLSHLIMLNILSHQRKICTDWFYKYIRIYDVVKEQVIINIEYIEEDKMSEQVIDAEQQNQINQEEQYPQEQEQQMDEEEQAQQDDYNYDDYEIDDLELGKSLSKDQPYSIYHIEQLLKKIWEEISDKAAVCAMSHGWTLMLYYFTDFNSNYFDDLIDQDQTGRNLIKYSQGYTVTPLLGECGVCLCEAQLLNNACGHRFCKECWKFHININHTDRNIYELFPLCQQEGCYKRTNYQLIESLWYQDHSIKQKFQKLLCLKYSLKSIRVKICPNQTCGKAIYMNSVTEPTVICECGTELCRHCGYSAHWPLECVDLKNWQSMVNDKDNQWINKLVTQKCPLCKQTIQKNQGCIHMTCVCKYQFCWICMKIWKGHTNYYECSSVKRDDFQKKLKEEQQKKSLDQDYYNQRFEEAKGQAQRLLLLIKRVGKTNFQNILKRLEGVQVLKIHSDVLKQLKEFILKGWSLTYRCTIYTFFQREHFTELRRLIFRLNKGANDVDDFIYDILPKKFKQSDEKISKNLETAQDQKIAMKKFFLSGKQQMNAKARQGMRIIELINLDRFSQALKQVCNEKSSLYIAQQPSFFVKKQVQQLKEQVNQSEQI